METPCVSTVDHPGSDGGDGRRLHRRRSREEPKPVLICSRSSSSSSPQTPFTSTSCFSPSTCFSFFDAHEEIRCAGKVVIFFERAGFHVEAKLEDFVFHLMHPFGDECLKIGTDLKNMEMSYRGQIVREDMNLNDLGTNPRALSSVSCSVACICLASSFVLFALVSLSLVFII